MKKLSLLIILLVPFFHSFSQAVDPRYLTHVTRSYADSVTGLTEKDTLELNWSDTSKDQIFFDRQIMSVVVYAHGTFYTFAGGNVIDTTSLSNRINDRVVIENLPTILSPYLLTMNLDSFNTILGYLKGPVQNFQLAHSSIGFNNSRGLIWNSGNIGQLGNSITSTIDSLTWTSTYQFYDSITVLKSLIGATGDTILFGDVHGGFHSTQISSTYQLTNLTNQGTANEVLHGNISGAISYSSVSLTTDVSGILPIAQGGNGTATPYIRGGPGVNIVGPWGSDSIYVSTSSGTVTSVALSLPSFLTVSGSPVTTSGTLTAVLASQSANVLFGTKSSGAPAFFNIDSSLIIGLHTSAYYATIFQALENQRLSTTNNVAFASVTLLPQSFLFIPTHGHAWEDSVGTVLIDSANKRVFFSQVLQTANSSIRDSFQNKSGQLALLSDVNSAGVVATNTAGYVLNAYKVFYRANTDSILEGSTNLFYTSARVQAVINGDTATLLATKYFAQSLDTTIKTGSGILQSISGQIKTLFIDSTVYKTVYAASQLTISGVKVGGNLFSLTNGYGITSLTYNGSSTLSFSVDTATGKIATQFYVGNQGYLTATTANSWLLSGNPTVARTKFIGTTDTSRLYFGTKGILNSWLDSSQVWVIGDTAISTFQPSIQKVDIMGRIRLSVAGVPYNPVAGNLNATDVIITNGGIRATQFNCTSTTIGGSTGLNGMALSGSSLIFGSGGLNYLTMTPFGNQGGFIDLIALTHTPNTQVPTSISGDLAITTTITPAANNLQRYVGVYYSMTYQGTASLFTIINAKGFNVGATTFANGTPDFRAMECDNTQGYAFVDSLRPNYFGGSITIGGSFMRTPASSALIDMSSTTQGILFPLMTSTQIAAISSPVNGLFVFNSTTGFPNWYNSTTSAWNESMVATTGSHTNGQIGIYNATTATYTVGTLVMQNGLTMKAGAGTDTLGYKLSYSHTIFTPTTGGTVALVNNQYNIINPTGALLALTVNLPSSPSNNDVVYIKFTQNVTTVTYANGTVVDGITAPTAGGLTILEYDTAASSWY